MNKEIVIGDYSLPEWYYGKLLESEIFRIVKGSKSIKIECIPLKMDIIISNNQIIAKNIEDEINSKNHDFITLTIKKLVMENISFDEIVKIVDKKYKDGFIDGKESKINEFKKVFEIE